MANDNMCWIFTLVGLLAILPKPSSAECGDVFISERLNSGPNIAVELFNGLSTPVDVSTLSLYYFSDITLVLPQTPIPLGVGTIQPGDTWVVCNDLLDDRFIDRCDFTIDLLFIQPIGAMGLYSSTDDPNSDPPKDLVGCPTDVADSAYLCPLNPLVTTAATVITLDPTTFMLKFHICISVSDTPIPVNLCRLHRSYPGLRHPTPTSI